MRTLTCSAAVLAALLAILAVADRIDTLPAGLEATCFSGVTWSSAPVRSLVDPSPSTDSLLAACAGAPSDRFSATWAGTFVTLQAGTYTFATDSDDGSWVYVDGRLVVDNGGPHGVQSARGTVTLGRGLHTLFVKYFQDGGALLFSLSWARGSESLAPLPSWMLFPRSRELPRLLASVVIRRALWPVFWLWFAATILALLVNAAPAIGRGVVPWLTGDPIHIALAGVIAGSMVLNSVGLWWGAPSLWAGDELTPTAIFVAMAAHFSHGWFERYTPFHYYVLSATFAPWLALKWLGAIHLTIRAETVLLIVLERSVSVVMAAATLVAVSVYGTEAFGRRAGLFAAAMMALVTPFVYYAKTANTDVPYLCWFAVSLVFLGRALRHPTYRNVVPFAAAGIIAICTKDQAYGLFVPTPFLIVYALWRDRRDQNDPHPLRRALVDGRLAAAAIVTVALFVAINNIPFNAAGFADHLRDITGPAITYRMVGATLAGRLTLVGIVSSLDLRSLGWPFWLIAAAGVVTALREPSSRRAAICLLIIGLSYYLTFIEVIRFVYDRFLLPVCLIQALFGGVAIDRHLAATAGRARRAAAALVAAAFAYTFLYAATVDVLMLRDARYTAERWLDAHAGSDAVVGTMFSGVFQPRMDDFKSVNLDTVEELSALAPAYVVMNADYARAVNRGTPNGQLIAGLEHHALGYRLAFRYRSSSPWPWLPDAHPALVGARHDVPVVSFLQFINPEIDIYARGPS